MAKSSQGAGDGAGVPDLPGVMHPDQLAGQLRDIILAHVQGMRCPWNDLPAAEQKAYIDSASQQAVEIIDNCLDCILVDGKGVIVDATANDVVFKKESIQTRINVQYGADNSQLFKSAAHKPIKLVFAPQRDKVRDLGATPKPASDQPAMFDDESDVVRGKSTAKHISEVIPPKPRARRGRKPKAAQDDGGTLSLAH